MPDAQLPSHPAQAALISDGSNMVLHISRDVAGSDDDVWAAITQPDMLARWTPFRPDRVMDTQGPISLHATDGSVDDAGNPLILDGTITDVDPRRSVSYHWGTQPVRFSHAASTVTIAHTLDDQNQAAKMAAGWHLCLGALELLLEGNDPPMVVGEDAANQFGWQDLHDQYDRLFADRQDDLTDNADRTADR